MSKIESITHIHELQSKIRRTVAITDKPGKFMLINKNDLYVDHSYQRDKINKLRVSGMLSEFSWAAFGVLCVSMRNGKWHVFDGQHRALAAMKIDAIEEVPCMVFESATLQSEAKTFLAANSNRSAVNATTKYKAGLVANDPICLGIQAAADAFGYTITENAGKPFDIACVSALMKCESSSKGSVIHILKNAIPLAAQGVLTSTIVRALDVLRVNIDGGLSNKTFQSRISVTPIPVLETYMRNEALISGSGTPLIWAKGILKAINANHRQKIKMEKHEESL